MISAMSDATQLIIAIRNGDELAARKLFPLIYEELRSLAAHWMAREKPGQTLQPTELVNEAYLRLVGVPDPQQFDGQRHFFAAAAEAMRRILVDRARRRNSLKRGGKRERQPLDSELIACPPDARPIDDLLALDDALNKLAAEDASKADLVKLRYFAGLTLAQASAALGISGSTADRWWAYAKAFLYQEVTSSNGKDAGE
jgi:RNA polymerase sigma factor (TIGR02999 family)